MVEVTVVVGVEVAVVVGVEVVVRVVVSVEFVVTVSLERLGNLNTFFPIHFAEVRRKLSIRPPSK